MLSFEAFQLVGALGKGWGRHWFHASAGLVSRLPNVLFQRRAFQRHRQLGDGDVLTGGPLPFNPALTFGRLERSARMLLEGIAALNWSAAHRFLRSTARNDGLT